MPGGIVDAADEAQRRTVRSEPAVWTAIGLHQQPGLGHALAVPTTRCRAARPGTAYALSEQQLAHGGTTELQSCVVERLGQMLLVQTGVLVLRQLEHPGTHLRRHAWQGRRPRSPCTSPAGPSA